MNELEEIKQNDYILKVLVILFLIIVILLGLVYKQIETEGARCAMNPLVYGVGQYSGAEEGAFSCSCAYLNDKSFLYVTSENITLIKPAIGGLNLE